VEVAGGVGLVRECAIVPRIHTHTHTHTHTQLSLRSAVWGLWVCEVCVGRVCEAREPTVL